MPFFEILRGPTVICQWNTENQSVVFHLRASHQGGILALSESEKVSFALTPSPEAEEYRIVIGDMPLSDLVPNPEDAGGVSIGGRLLWREFPYFESARGRTRILLERQAFEFRSRVWRPAGRFDVFIHPTKLGEQRYQRMADDLEQISRSLLVDLYGKSTKTHDLRYAKEGKVCGSREEELAAIDKVVTRLSVLLGAIGRQPVSRMAVVPTVNSYWGGEGLTPSAVTALCRDGTSLQTCQRPVRIRSQRKVESFDIAEHRITHAFLNILLRRLRYCAEVARGHIQAIASERPLRHIRFDGRPSLYETEDLPRIRRLEEAVARADFTRSIATNLLELPFIRHAKPQIVVVRGGTFQRSPEYRELLRTIRRYLQANAIWYEGDETSAITKLTSRLFEQWCYLQIVEAFRGVGLELQEWNQTLRQNLRSRFILDFDRGLSFDGVVNSELRLRLRYEPWILGIDSARKAKETLCRGSVTDVPWSPDIVIECLKREGQQWRPVYGIVLDCKYTFAVTDQHWNDTAKYLHIRCTETRRQIVKQLWLVAPAALHSSESIKSDDPAVDFDQLGPSCPPDEAVRFSLFVVPAGEADDTQSNSPSVDMFHQFASGTMTYLRKYFCGGATSIP